jgi:methyl-accepting chemotaxis protein
VQFLKASIATRFLVVGLTVVAIASLGGVVGGYHIWSAGKQFRVYENIASDALLASEINADMAKVLLNAREYLATRSDEDLRDTRRFIAETREGIAKALTELHAPDRAALVKKISEAFKHFEEGFEEIVLLLDERDRIVTEVLDIIGPQLRKGMTQIIATAQWTNEYETVVLGGIIQEDLITARLYIAKYLLNNNKKDAERAISEFAEIDKEIDKLEFLLTTSAKEKSPMAASFASIRPLLAQYREGFGALQKVIEKRNWLRATTLDGDGKAISDWAAAIKESAIRSEDELSEKMLGRITRDEIVITAIAVLAFLFGGLASYLSARALSRPILQLAAQMRVLAAGDTNIRLDQTARRDEIGEMTKAVAVFRDNALEREKLSKDRDAQFAARAARQNRLEALVRDFDAMSRTMLESVGANSIQMEAMAKMLTEIANNTLNNINTAAAGSDNASDNVEEMAVAATNLSQSIEGIGTQVDMTAKAVAQVAARANDTNEKVKNLAEATKEIGDVVAIIRAVAEQTNLLALNATIEAARAGTAGRGFAVVASEVKTLAGQTGSATDAIARQIESVQNSTADVVASIAEITKAMSDVNTYALSIAAAVRHQSQETGQIRDAVRHAAAGTRVVSANLNEVAASASETSRSADQVFRASNDVARRTQDLSEQITSFLKKIATA